ncbi:DNA-binding response regulator, OmpR family, contains REC and winged-helix (wHTH) domain [Butyrivibrio hungatei DSM 14810]|uniref:Stage 0 sporulation protein A homolog n=1 Tax=Butyrivibrio hungatei DSM 14810 TaxID=1121132 RepID=A0A1M7SQS1_9FIRM|nr:response regulator transcription factor [Butyrivibrio hungatei]SHN60786.1 DNA-binding response regulator, OmpR family, contains REC and winged-helix (wHTH) domain [Butyrivibrio hungatei DSM 14810]
MNIFLLEDDDAIGMGLKYSLEKEGYNVTLTKSVAQAKELFEEKKNDLCILDINLPDGNGYEVCKYIKEKEDVPVIFLTASDAEVNVVMGLEMGADDYVCKPFRVGELMARIKTVLRRAGKNQSVQEANDNIIKINNVNIYTNEAKVTITKETAGEEEQVELTALEYRLLLTFCNNRGTVLSRNKLLEDMWDVSGDFVNDNTLTVYIKRLRDKIEKDPAKPEIIKTVRGLGYIVDK